MQQAFGISKRPIAIGFLQAPPSGMHPWPAGSVPAGCSFWKAAWEGQSFYTVASDHYNCAVGAYTHGISLPAERGTVLSDTIGFMVDQGYLRMPEVPWNPGDLAGSRIHRIQSGRGRALCARCRA